MVQGWLGQRDLPYRIDPLGFRKKNGPFAEGYTGARQGRTGVLSPFVIRIPPTMSRVPYTVGALLEHEGHLCKLSVRKVQPALGSVSFTQQPNGVVNKYDRLADRRRHILHSPHRQ